MRRDKLTKSQRSQLMARIKSRGTDFERKIFQALRRKGLRFQTHYSKVIGNPDIALPKFRKAVFLHSDFWHGWRLSAWESVLPGQFWKDKLHKNRARDRIVLRRLRKKGWKVLVIWEHQIDKDLDAAIDLITEFLRSKS